MISEPALTFCIRYIRTDVREGGFLLTSLVPKYHLYWQCDSEWTRLGLVQNISGETSLFCVHVAASVMNEHDIVLSIPINRLSMCPTILVIILHIKSYKWFDNGSTVQAFLSVAMLLCVWWNYQETLRMVKWCNKEHCIKEQTQSTKNLWTTHFMSPRMEWLYLLLQSWSDIC